MGNSLMPMVAALTASWIMVRAGMKKRAFEWRHPERRCASCRRLQRDCTCSR